MVSGIQDHSSYIDGPMYQPDKYARNERKFIFPFIQAHPFATLVGSCDRLYATHTPVLAEGTKDDFVLFGHVANHNPLKQAIDATSEALLIFRGPDAYVSSSWYEKADVSTWNYSAVHINGRMRPQNRDELENSLDKLVHVFESGEEQPLYYGELSDDILKSHLPRITGFWFHPDRMRGVKKWSQARSKRDREHIKTQLKERGLDTDMLDEHLGLDED